MTTLRQTTDQEEKRPYIKASEQELDALQTSIMHSVIQGESSISFWNQELTAIRHERKQRKEQGLLAAAGEPQHANG